MILPVLKNFVVAKGVGFDYRFQWNEGVPGSSVPTDLTLYQGILTISNYNGSVIYSTLTSSASQGQSGVFFGGATSDPTNGIIDIVITANDTYSLNFKTARYKLMMTPQPTPNLPQQLLYGTFSVLAGA